MKKSKCMICEDDVSDEEIKHLPIYVMGSEGVWACLKCQIAIANFVREMMSVGARVKLNIIKKERKRIEKIGEKIVKHPKLSEQI